MLVLHKNLPDVDGSIKTFLSTYDTFYSEIKNKKKDQYNLINNYYSIDFDFYLFSSKLQFIFQI